MEKVQLQQLLKENNENKFYTFDFPENINDLNRDSEFGISLVSLNEDFRREYEPNSPSYLERISCLKDLHDYGFKTFVNISTHNSIQLDRKNLNQLLKIVSFVDKILIVKISEFEINNAIVDFCNANYIKYCILD